MSSERDDDDPKYLPVVVVPDSAVVFHRPSTVAPAPAPASVSLGTTAQLMVAMQPEAELPSVGVQEVVVVTGHGDRRFGSGDGNRGRCYWDGVAERSTRGEDEGVVVDASESVAAEIEVVDARSFEEFLANGFRGSRSDLFRRKPRKGRFKRKGRFAKRSPVKVMSSKRTVESSPEFYDSESDAIEEAGYGRSALKPRKRNFAHRLQWRDADMQAALIAVREKNMTIRGAAKQFSVPYSTLKDRVRNRVKHGTKPGVKTALSPEDEEELVRCIQQMESAGFQLHGIDIREQAHEFLNRNQLCSANSKVRTSAPGHNWLAGFLKRHPGIEIKRSVNRPVVPSFSKQKHMLRRFFDATSCAYQKLHKSTQASQLYTVTEFKLSSFPNTSVILAAAANGMVLPPYVLFNGSRILMRGLQQHFPTAFFATRSSSGQQKDVLLSWFRDHFLRHVQQGSQDRPVVLFVGQPACNISVHLIQLANDRQVSLVCIPAGISHLVQPLDNAVVREIDDLITKRGRRHLEDRKMPSMDQIGMAEVLQKVWQRGLPSKEIVSNFNENGLFPFNTRAVTHERITSSTPLVDVSKEEAAMSDNETNGLTLLSELSSLKHEDQGVDETKYFDFNRKRAYGDDNSAEFSQFKRQNNPIVENSSFDTNSFAQEILSERVNSDSVAPRLSEELMKHVLANGKQEVSCSRTRRTRRVSRCWQRPDVQQEILASRTNPEQLELAIKSIIDESSETASPPQRQSQSVASDLQTLRFSTGFRNSQSVRGAMRPSPSNGVGFTMDDGASKYASLTPVQHVIEINPDVKQECISYSVQEEFVPQEIVEEQTVIQDCMNYEMSSNAFSKEPIVEELVEEVVDLPELILSASELIETDRIKIENVDHEFFNNNELNYDLQAEVSNATGSAQSGLSVKMLNLLDVESDLNLNNSDTAAYIEVNGRSYPVIQTLSIQEFRKTFGFIS